MPLLSPPFCLPFFVLLIPFYLSCLLLYISFLIPPKFLQAPSSPPASYAIFLVHSYPLLPPSFRLHLTYLPPTLSFLSFLSFPFSFLQTPSDLLASDVTFYFLPILSFLLPSDFIWPACLLRYLIFPSYTFSFLPILFLSFLYFFFPSYTFSFHPILSFLLPSDSIWPACLLRYLFFPSQFPSFPFSFLQTPSGLPASYATFSFLSILSFLLPSDSIWTICLLRYLFFPSYPFLSPSSRLHLAYLPSTLPFLSFLSFPFSFL